MWPPWNQNTRNRHCSSQTCCCLASIPNSIKRSTMLRSTRTCSTDRMPGAWRYAAIVAELCMSVHAVIPPRLVCLIADHPSAFLFTSGCVVFLVVHAVPERNREGQWRILRVASHGAFSPNYCVSHASTVMLWCFMFSLYCWCVQFCLLVLCQSALCYRHCSHSMRSLFHAQQGLALFIICSRLD